MHIVQSCFIKPGSHMSPIVGELLYSVHTDKEFYTPTITDNDIADIWEPGFNLYQLCVNYTNLTRFSGLSQRNTSFVFAHSISTFDWALVLWSGASLLVVRLANNLEHFVRLQKCGIFYYVDGPKNRLDTSIVGYCSNNSQGTWCTFRRKARYLQKQIRHYQIWPRVFV